MYMKGALLAELPFVVLSHAIIWSPYLLMLLMLRKASKTAQSKASQINYATFSTLISLVGIGLLFSLIYVIPDAQNGIFIMLLAMFQWLCVGLCLLIGSVLGLRTHAKNVQVDS